MAMRRPKPRAVQRTKATIGISRPASCARASPAARDRVRESPSAASSRAARASDARKERS
eukprot:scaffold4631_cov74-Isochrysis_galbana.AAC.2